MTTTTKSFFDTCFDKTETAIEYNEKWENGTGYLDHAVKGPAAPILTAGQVVKSTTLQGRKILFVGTAFGNCVIFKRYTEGPVVVSNLPRHVTDLYTGTSVGTSLDTVTLTLLLGCPDIPLGCPNVGIRIDRIRAACAI